MSANTTQQNHQDAGRQLVEWIVKHRRTVLLAVAGLAAAILVVWFVLEYGKRKELAATGALNEARGAVQAGNLPLAASDLARVTDTYGGTVAADEATILLAQVRLQQDQPTVAADELRAALASGMRPQFEAAALGLLGTALEEIGNHREAGEAFERASGASWYEFVAAQYLIDAGRAFLAARDTTRAIAAYERVLSDFEEAPATTEARVRVAELRAAMGG
ncbi:MAG: tetratricopeptide repeat protein [Gemmatimonadota bacterium]|nr:MAG: tetratricopeptide repeat protein [Gemmatimonadota bacterium]